MVGIGGMAAVYKRRGASLRSGEWVSSGEGEGEGEGEAEGEGEGEGHRGRGGREG
jgi:hypothetical protein